MYKFTNIQNIPTSISSKVVFLTKPSVGIHLFLKIILKLNLIHLFYLQLETNFFNAKLTSFVHRNTDGSASSFKSATDPFTTNLTFKCRIG